MRAKTPEKITAAPRVASTSTEDLASFLKQHAPAADPEQLSLVPKTELKPYQVKAQEEDAKDGLVTVFYRGAKGEELAALSGGPGVSFVPADLTSGETAFKARHEKAHAFDARSELDPLTDETRTRIAQAVTGPDYAGHAQDLEIRRAEADLPAATPAQEFDELAADTRALLYGAKGKTAGAQRSSLNGWVNQVAEAEPGRFHRLKAALTTYAAKVGIPGVTLPDVRCGTVEQRGAVADAAIAELRAARPIRPAARPSPTPAPPAASPARSVEDASVPEFAPAGALSKTERTLANGNYFAVVERTGAAGKFARGGIIVQPYKNHQADGPLRHMTLAEARAMRHFTEDDLVDISHAMDREEGMRSSGVSNLQAEIKSLGAINPDLARRELKDKMLDLKASPGVFNKKSRNSPDDLAEQLGYESGDALMDALRDELETGRPQFVLGVKGEAQFSMPDIPGKPVAELSGDELGNYGADTGRLRDAAVAWYKEYLQRGTPAVRKDLGKIFFTRKGFKEFEHFGADPAKLKMVVALKQIIEQGDYRGPSALLKKRKDNIRLFHNIDADVDLEGRQYHVRVLVAEDSRRNKFFDLFPDVVAYETKKASRGSADRELNPGPPEGLSESVAAPDQNIAPADKDVKKDPLFSLPQQQRRLFRGERDGKGTGIYRYGKALYVTTNRKYAAAYGDVKEVAVEWPKNPLVIGRNTSFDDWLLEKSGARNLREFHAQHPDPGEFVRSQGYDGVVDADVVVIYSPLFKPEAKLSLANARTTPAARDPEGASRLARAFSGRGLSVVKAAEHALKYWPAGGKPAEDIISTIPEGRQYLQRVERAWWETRRRIASWAHPLNVARRDLDRADRHYIRTSFLRDYEEGGAEQSWQSPAVAEFARAWRDVNTTIAEEVGGLIESFTGRDPDTYVPHRLTDKGRAILQKKNGPEWDALVEAAKVAGIDIHVLEGLHQDPLRQQKYGSIDYARIANLPWEVTTDGGKVVKILETDPEVLFAHVRGAARRLSTIEEFGADESSSEYLDQVAAGLVSSGALDSESTREAVARIWKRLEGQDAMAGRELFGKAHDLWQAVDSVVAALNLSGAVIGNLVGGHLPESVRMGFVPTVRAFKDAYTTSLKNPSLDDLHALVDLEGDLLHDLQATETLEGRVAKGASKFLAGTGFVAANRRINLAVALAMQRQNLRLMLERVASGKKSGKLWGQDADAARRYLTEELRFSEEDVERMAFEGSTDADMARAIGKELELVNAMNESPGSRPRWVAHPIWRMGFAYSTFVRKMWDTTKFAAREAQAGNVRPLATLLVAGTVTAEIMAAIKDLLKDREKEDKGFLERLANDMVEVGALGLAGAWKYGIMRLGDPQASLWDDVTKPPHIETFDALFVSGPGRALAQKSFKPLWKNAAGIAPAVDIFDKQATKVGLFGKGYAERDYAERLVNKVYLRDRTGKPGAPAREALDPIPSKHKDNTSRRMVDRLRKSHDDSAILEMIRDAKDRREGTQ